MSGETKFTPGPWAKVKSSTLYIAPASDRNRVIARIQCKRPAMFEQEPEVDANARLIAAAPEMYALLERFAAWYDLRKLGAAPTRILDEMAEGAKKTLAAVRGEGA